MKDMISVSDLYRFINQQIEIGAEYVELEEILLLYKEYAV